MDTMLGFVGLVITSLVALFAALALQTLLLRAAFALMQPATASRRVPQPAVEHGTQLVARAFSTARWFGESFPLTICGRHYAQDLSRDGSRK